MSEPICVGPGIGGPTVCKKCGHSYSPSAEYHACPSGPEAQRKLPELQAANDVLRFAAKTARRERDAIAAERDRLRAFVEAIAEGDCAYGMPPSCPRPRCGICVSCAARAALRPAPDTEPEP